MPSSWLLLAVPAWIISPWLVLPAIVLVEGVWIAGLQWSWHHEYLMNDGEERTAHPGR